ncbi:MAG: cytochrome-c peroxidase [Thiotrichales bacterium]|nr:cytochrome-c peroxidase [Thiotrichales bacterium]
MTRQLKLCAAIGLTAILTATPLLAGKPLSEPIKPIPATVDVDPKKVSLGRMLFHDVRLSKGETVSCSSCHDLTHGGDDGVQVSTGIDGKQGHINSPTVYNTGFLFRLFWDGRAESLEDQVDGPIQNPIEMGSLWPDVVAKLYEDAEYPKMFNDTFGSGISRQNIKLALAEFQRSLITPNSRFDQYLLGDANAITAQEKTGYENFKKYGCISCHQGTAVGGNMFQLFGVANSYFQNRGNITKADMGRFNVTGNVLDKHTFKVPSLRLAALTAPYLHDGNAPTLRAAVDIMFKFQLGREAPDEDKDAIVAFIKTLAGEHPEMKK